MKGVVLFYPTGIVHLRNLEIIKKACPEFRFIVIVEPWLKNNASKVLDTIKPEDQLNVSGQEISQTIWDEPVDALFLSMAYPNLFRLNLVYEAARRDILVIAIEEVNQLALNDGIINHYFLPVDFFGVASAVEREKFIETGIPKESIKVTGWPFFNQGLLNLNSGENVKREFGIPDSKKCCLLVLGSLKESDIVSLETHRIRLVILEQLAQGLPEDFVLLIKPHPIETQKGIEEIQNRVLNSVIVDPKFPIEPLLHQSDIVVNRGNSQVTLLALMLKKPIIIIPVGLKTIFSGVADSVISNSSSDFKRILAAYNNNKTINLGSIWNTHNPCSQDESWLRIRELFKSGLAKKSTWTNKKLIYISILYAFLREKERAVGVLKHLSGHPSLPFLKKLYDFAIGAEEFKDLLLKFPEKIIQWHLQALFIRSLFKNTSADLAKSIPLLRGFDGHMNPHYFIDDIISRIELEYRAGREETASILFNRFCEDYSIFPYYRQAFNMIRFVYLNHNHYHRLRKAIWLIKNLTKNYTRKYIKEKLKRE